MYGVVVEIFGMLYVLHVNIAKADLTLHCCICCKCFIWMLEVFNLDVAPSMRDLNVPCNMKQMLRRVFFLIINKWLTTFFNIFLMLQMMVFYVADVFLLCCERLMLPWTDRAFDEKNFHETSGR